MYGLHHWYISTKLFHIHLVAITLLYNHTPALIKDYTLAPQARSF